MLALLLAALSPFATAKAQDVTVWSATLTVDIDDPLYGCSNELSSLDNCSASTVLTKDEFSYGGSTYGIRLIFWDANGGILRFGISKDGVPVPLTAFDTELSSWTLNVDSASFVFANQESTSDTRAFWTWDPASDWTDGQTVSLSLTAPRPTAPDAVRFNFGGGEDNRLQIGIRRPTSGIVSGYDVHYTSTFTNEVADDAPAEGSDPTFAWVVWNDPIHAGSQQRVITGLTNGLEYRVRVRAKNSAGNGPWTVGRHTVGLRVIRLTPDPNFLTVLTINDGTNELKLQPNVANAVGLGGPGIYAVFVNLGIRQITVTPTWTSTTFNTALLFTEDVTTGGSLSTETVGNGESATLSLLPYDGVTLLTIEGFGGGKAYKIYVYHTSEWNTLDARLKKLEMLTN